MEQKIKQLIKQYVTEYAAQEEIATDQREPIVKFAAADDQLFTKLQEVASSTHVLPQDILPEATTVITYFLPFVQGIAASNRDGKYSSREWAIAYAETNQLIGEVNNHLQEELTGQGYKTALIPATHNFDKSRLVSDWSHRHAAYIAGLGKFGLNNMLITEQGCCGCVGSLITSLELEPSQRDEEEYCLYKRSGGCKKCVSRCVKGALQVDSFDRDACYELLLTNDEHHSELGLSDVCGKCSVDLPCSLTNPVSNK